MEDLFLKLYQEFIEYLEQENLLTSCIMVNYDKTPFVNFQFITRKLLLNEKKLQTDLPSFNNFFEKLSEVSGKPLEEITTLTQYEIFADKFSELFNHINSSNIAIQIAPKNDFTRLVINDESLNKAIINGNHSTSKNTFLIIFEYLEIEKEFQLNESISFIQLDDDFIRNRIKKDHEPDINWVNVKSAIKIEGEFDPKIIIQISTLLRLFKKGDLKYKDSYQEKTHYFKGQIFQPCKTTRNETDYIEHSPVKTPMFYKIKNDDIKSLVPFLNTYLDKTIPFIHSCQVYNLLPSINLNLKIPIIFSIFESFFSDITSEVVFRLSLYITNLLDEDKAFLKKIKDFYTIRSKVSHGDFPNVRKKLISMHKSETISSPTLNSTYEEIDQILKKLWLKLMDLNWDPQKSSKLIQPFLIKKE